MQTQPQDVTATEAAEMLNVHQLTILRWIRAGRLKTSGTLKSARAGHRIPRSEVERVAAEQAARLKARAAELEAVAK